MARPIKRKVSPKRIAIVGDGLTEKWYFQQLKAAEPSLRGILAIEPKLPKASGFRHCLATAETLCKEDYDEVHCLIDYDQVLYEDAVVFLNTRTEMLFTRYGSKIYLYVLNPCFEIWLYLHFQYSTKSFENCGKVEKKVAGFLPGYNKSNQFWESNNVYSILRKDLFFEAVKNAHTLEKIREKDQHHLPRAEMYKLMAHLIPPTQEEYTMLQKLFHQ
jgi:hypothetical protein